MECLYWIISTFLLGGSCILNSFRLPLCFHPRSQASYLFPLWFFCFHRVCWGWRRVTDSHENLRSRDFICFQRGVPSGWSDGNMIDFFFCYHSDLYCWYLHFSTEDSCCIIHFPFPFVFSGTDFCIATKCDWKLIIKATGRCVVSFGECAKLCWYDRSELAWWYSGLSLVLFQLTLANVMALLTFPWIMLCVLASGSGILYESTVEYPILWLICLGDLGQLTSFIFSRA